MRLASVLLIGSIALFSGCASQPVPLAPAVLKLPDCPAPHAPHLPQLADAPLDAPENVATLMARDDALRQYIAGLRATLNCYQAQNAKEHHESQ